MIKKKESLSVGADLSKLFIEEESANRSRDRGLSINQALAIVIKQMTAIGLRPRTISDYEQHARIRGLQSITEASAGSVYK